MAIGISAGGLRCVTRNQTIPNTVKTALTAPGPVVVDTGTVDGQVTPVIAGVAANRLRYLGYSFKSKVAAGEQAALANGAVVDGFTGGAPDTNPYVYVADGGGITDVAPAAAPPAIGKVLTATKILFFNDPR